MEGPTLLYPQSDLPSIMNEIKVQQDGSKSEDHCQLAMLTLSKPLDLSFFTPRFIEM